MAKEFKPYEILANPENFVCTCPKTECEWFGNCRDCVALHRYIETVPNCMNYAGDTK